MAPRARAAGVQIVTGDTKVVERGACDRLYINTAATRHPAGVESARPRPAGRRLLVNGLAGRSRRRDPNARGDLALTTAGSESDCAALHA